MTRQWFSTDTHTTTPLWSLLYVTNGRNSRNGSLFRSVPVYTQYLVSLNNITRFVFIPIGFLVRRISRGSQGRTEGLEWILVKDRTNEKWKKCKQKRNNKFNDSRKGRAPKMWTTLEMDPMRKGSKPPPDGVKTGSRKLNLQRRSFPGRNTDVIDLNYRSPILQ